MASDYNEAGVYLGAFDTIFMTCYSIGLFISGWVGERVELRLLISIGTLFNATTLFIFGYVLPMVNCKVVSISMIMIGLNGFAQSVGWPTLVALMSNWFGIEGRGVILGTWSACQYVGNILGAMIVNQFLLYGFEYAFLVIAFSLLLISSKKDLESYPFGEKMASSGSKLWGLR